MTDDFFNSAERLIEYSQTTKFPDSDSPLFSPDDLLPPRPTRSQSGALATSTTTASISGSRKRKKRKKSTDVCIYFLLSRDFGKREIPILKGALEKSFGATRNLVYTRNPRDPRLTHILTKHPTYPSALKALEFEPPEDVTICLTTWVAECRRANRYVTPSPVSTLERCRVNLDRLVTQKQQESVSRQRTAKRRRTALYEMERRRTDVSQSMSMASSASSSSPPNKRRRVGDWGAIGEKAVERTTMQGNRLIDRTKRQFFACQRNADQPSANDHIAEKLGELQQMYEETGDQWRAFSYRKAIQAIRNMAERIETEEDALRIRGVGKSIGQKIGELFRTGQISKIQSFKTDPRYSFLRVAQKIWGVGLKTAEKWWNQGIRSLEEIRQRKDELLNDKQLVGLRYYTEFQTKIPRDEVERIFHFVRDTCLEVEPHALVKCCGSYRRGRPESGDVDILISDSRRGVRPAGLLRKVVAELRRKEFITEVLGMSETSHMDEEDDDHHDSFTGVCVVDTIPRRLDLKVWKRECWAFAVLYFTGDGHFNRSMRLWARHRGYSLSDHGIVECIRNASHEKIQEGRSVACETEEEIFELLELEYRTPTERNTGMRGK